MAERKNGSGRSGGSGKSGNSRKKSPPSKSADSSRRSTASKNTSSANSSKSRSSSSAAKKSPSKKRRRKKSPAAEFFGSLIKVLAGLILCGAAVLGVCLQRNILSADDIKGFLGIEDGARQTVKYSDSADFDFAVYYLDVGQGDSELIVSGDTSVLIDAGEAEYGQKVLSEIKKLGIKKLDYIIATHPHSDHIGGLAKVISGIDAGKIIVPKVPDDMTPTSYAYENFLNAVKDSGNKLTQAKAGDIYELGAGAEMEILAPIGEDYSDLNDFSIVCRISYKDTYFMFTGDASKESEADMVASGRELFSDVLNVGHHGSSTASTAEFLAEVAPSVCVISCGAGNSYGHPNEDTVKRLKKFTDNIYRTDLCGTIAVYSDGKRLYVKTEKTGSDN